MAISRKGAKPHQIYIYAKIRKAYVPCVIIAHRVKENILGYFTQRRKERTSSTLRKDAQSRFLALSIDFTKKKVEKIKN